jgi:hypothetical protein
MNIFLRMLELVTGKRVKEEIMGVSHDGRSSMDELSTLARLTRAAIKPRWKFAPPGKKLGVITTTGDADGPTVHDMNEPTVIKKS